MKNILLSLIIAFITIATYSQNTLVVNTQEGEHKIDKHIYGHFAEHLGRCIYEGIWVGTESPIPNTRGSEMMWFRH